LRLGKLRATRIRPLAFGEFLAFDDGERRLELRRMGPAHTIGDAVAFLPREGILFTGDLCVNWRSGNNIADRDADPANWVRALNALTTWQIRTIIRGHGNQHCCLSCFSPNGGVGIGCPSQNIIY